ncbi:MAG: hypothetical protein ACOZNI_34335 [Myxococcota bacterium]
MKAQSVTKGGEPDGWTPPRGFRAQTAPDGSTRLVISVPPEELPATHLALVEALGSPISIRYVRLTDRAKGQLPQPQTFVRMDLKADEVVSALRARAALVWGDGRHQTWIRGKYGEQVVLDELGVLYCYPDDPAFRDALAGLPETADVGMDGRDYVRVSFLAEADAQEASLLSDLGLIAWK